MLHTSPLLEPIRNALSALRAMFGIWPDWPDLQETWMLTNDLLLQDDPVHFGTSLFQSLKDWRYQRYHLRLLLQGDEKPRPR